MGKVDFSKFDSITRIALEDIERRLVSIEKKKESVLRQPVQQLDTESLFQKLAPKFYDIMIAKYPWLLEKMNNSIK